MRIGIAYNLKSDFSPLRGNGKADDQAEEFDLPETVDAIKEVLSREGHEVFLLGGGLEVIEKIKRWGIEFIFNIAEGFRGRNREAHLPSLFEMMEIPYSGSDPLGLAVSLDKAMAKRIAISLGIPTPAFWVLRAPDKNSPRPSLRGARHRTLAGDEAISKPRLLRPFGARNDVLLGIPNQFPLFVKPLRQGSSKGIRRSSRVGDRLALEKEILRLSENYPGEAILVEEYIEGREFTAGVIGNGMPEVIGVMEIQFRDPRARDFCYSLEVKRNFREEVEYRLLPACDQSIEEKIGRAACRLFECLELRDVARFDFRMNRKGEFYFLEVNPLPGLSPESGDLVILAQKKGWSYRDLILKIIRSAFSRCPELNARLHVH